MFFDEGSELLDVFSAFLLKDHILRRVDIKEDEPTPTNNQNDLEAASEVYTYV